MGDFENNEEYEHQLYMKMFSMYNEWVEIHFGNKESLFELLWHKQLDLISCDEEDSCKVYITNVKGDRLIHMITVPYQDNVKYIDHNNTDRCGNEDIRTSLYSCEIIFTVLCDILFGEDDNIMRNKKEFGFLYNSYKKIKSRK